MRVGLFIPCYVDQFYPQVARATLRLLESQGVEVEFPFSQTCCAQPLLNSGLAKESAPLARQFLKTFAGFDHVVCPSGSCTAAVRNHFAEILGESSELEEQVGRVHELCEFLHDVLKVKKLSARFPHVVGIHQSCHGLRELRLARSSERMDPPFSKVRKLLELVRDIQIADLRRSDECCGFGGTFAVAEEAVSVNMGRDRLSDHLRAGVEVITGVDMSCLMHLDGLARRAELPVHFRHVAEIIAGDLIS